MSASHVVPVLEVLRRSLLTWHIWDQHCTGNSSRETIELQVEHTASVRVKVGGKEPRYGYTQLSGKVWEERGNSVGS